ncbi:MAG: hypothetical protein M0C28_16260 [Candidatus Moduliflexus flocculans]|nr:hypothetical protein [Candidatus Moduliflexus flocculans]
MKVRLEQPRRAPAPGPHVRRRGADGRAPERAGRAAAGGGGQARPRRQRNAPGCSWRTGVRSGSSPSRRDSIGGLDIEVSGREPKARPSSTGPFQALRDLKDGQSVRIRTSP